MIFSLSRRAARWTPATTGENGELLFTADFVLELARLHLSEHGHESQATTELTSDRLKQVMQNPELRLAYELVPEIIAEYALRKLSAPADFAYVLNDRHGRSYSFKVTQHPVARPIHNNLASELLPASAVETIAKASSYAGAVSKALNAGEKLANLSVCVAPFGLELHLGRLEIR